LAKSDSAVGSNLIKPTGEWQVQSANCISEVASWRCHKSL